MLRKVPQKVLDEIAVGEVEALRDILNDPEKRLDPRHLQLIRKFLNDNKLMTEPEVTIQLESTVIEELPIPTFTEDDEEDLIDG